MTASFFAKCISIEEKESKDGDGFYIQNIFMVDGHRTYISTEEQDFEPGVTYKMKGELSVKGVKVFLDFKPSKFEKTDITLEGF